MSGQLRLALSVAALVVVCGTDGYAAKDTPMTTSGLPVPRYVSLKSDNVNVRAGPTKDNDVSWIFTRSGLPVEITAEYENWRRIRDSEGAEGWVYHSLLSGRRTAVVTMKQKEDLAPIYARADTTSDVAARLQAGVVTQVKRCLSGWCRVVGAVSTAGSNSSGSGASTPTRSWIDLVPDATQRATLLRRAGTISYSVVGMIPDQRSGIRNAASRPGQ